MTKKKGGVKEVRVTKKKRKKEWTTSEKRSPRWDALTGGAPLRVTALTVLTDEAVAGMTSAALQQLDALQLKALAPKLPKLLIANKELPSVIAGKRMGDLPAQVKKALLECSKACPDKFIDVVVKVHARC